MKRWRKKLQWKMSRRWYSIKLWFGWWYCDNCEKMHSPFTGKYDFTDSDIPLFYECKKGVFDVPVPKAYESDPDYFYELAKDLHRVG